MIGTFAGHRSGPLLTIAAAVVIALVFQPLRQRASLLANRLVYGHRATPYQVLSDFAAGMAGQLDLGDALDRMVSLLGGAAGYICHRFAINPLYGLPVSNLKFCNCWIQAADAGFVVHGVGKFGLKCGFESPPIPDEL